MKSEQDSFSFAETMDMVAGFSAPEAYKGLYAFHKYWGKKPAEPLRYLIKHLCPTKGLVCDPFMGSGTATLEASLAGRRVIGIDLNPVAVRLAQLLVDPPRVDEVQRSLKAIEKRIGETIAESYFTRSSDVATHYVWHAGKMEKVWIAHGKSRIESLPTDHDLAMSQSFAGYAPVKIRSPRFFTNSRINSHPTLTLRSLFQGRALRNIELIMTAIEELPKKNQEAMRLALTASVGQMSNMVFAITGRGKVAGLESDRMEVGSWVIGYWRPELHFEVNVWNCFDRRVKKLIKALHERGSEEVRVEAGSISDVNAKLADRALVTGDSLEVMQDIKDGSVDLILTDPPHSDRIPYLELSELWNAILNEEPNFKNEVVVSNAKERGKRASQYAEAMVRFILVASQKLTGKGMLVLFFNARSKESWQFINSFSSGVHDSGLNYLGCFPLTYSAASVVQDNRAGALRGDYGLVFSRYSTPSPNLLDIPGWSTELPTPV